MCVCVCVCVRVRVCVCVCVCVRERERERRNSVYLHYRSKTNVLFQQVPELNLFGTTDSHNWLQSNSILSILSHTLLSWMIMTIMKNNSNTSCSDQCTCRINVRNQPNVQIVQMGKFKQYVQGGPKVLIEFTVNYCIPTCGPPSSYKGHNLCSSKLNSAALFSSLSPTTRATELSPELQA
jgi:hypothetical protein